MPTIQEIIAKRKELGPTATTVDAKNAITPVSPITQSNQDQLAANRARVQSQIASGERPAVGTSVTPQAEQTQAPTPPPAPVTSSTTPSGATMNADGTVTPANPVAPVTPTTPPVATTPTPVTPKVEPVKTPVVDYTQAQGREQEIMSNLEKFKTQGMTPDQIKGASGYENATPEKKAIIEGFLNPVKQDAGTIFSTLRAGGSVPMSDTPEYRQAQARYNTFKRFSTYDVASLSTAMQQGDLLMGTQAYNDVISDPNMLAKIQKARIFMNGEVDMVKIGEKQGQYVMTQNPTVAKALEDGYITTEEYNQMTSTPEVEAQAKVVSEAKTKYDEYKRQLEQISDDVDKEYEGKETTDSFRSAIKANRDKAVRRLYNSASDDLQNASGLYTELKNSSTQRLELNMKQYEQKQADARQLASEERAVQRSKDALQYEADFNKKQAELALKDPATAIKSVMDEYKKLGIPFTSTVQSRLAEFKASGKPLEQYLTEMGENIQQSPAYKAYSAKKENEGVQFQTFGNKVYKIQNGQMIETGVSVPKDSQFTTIGYDANGKAIMGFVNEQTGQVTPYRSSGGQTSTFNGDTTSYIASKEGFRDTAYQDSAGVWTIGYGTTKINGKPIQPGQKITQEEAQKLLGEDIAKHSNWKKYIDENTLSPSQKASLASFEYNLGPGIWDKSAMNIINMIKSGDLSGAGAEMQKYVNAGGKVIKGLQNRRADEARLLMNTGTGTQGASSDAKNWFNLIQKGTTSYEDVMKKLGGTKVGQAVLQEINGLISSQGGAIPALPDSPQVKQMDTLLDTVKGIVNDPNAIENLSGFFQTSPLDAMTGKNDDTRSAIEFLVKGQTLQQLIDAKAQGATFGALSNEELKMLQNSANRLTSMIEFDETGKVKNFKGSEKTVKAELKKLLDTFTEKREKMVNPGINKNIVPNQSVPVQTTTNTGVTNTGGGQTTDSLGIR